MKNYLLFLRFDGSAFHGSQKQANDITVQQEIETALKCILRADISITACSRTDAGVHANMFCCNFFFDGEFEPRRLIRGLNAVLPTFVAVYDCKEVPDNFNARKSAIGKEYIYRIWNGEQRNPFAEKYALHFHRKLDAEFLDSQAKQYVGTFDFTSFCASGGTTATNVRTITDCSVKRDGDWVIFTVSGNGFLYNMVRIMVGTLLDISDGKIPEDSIPSIINSKNRSAAGITAKPDGLYLNRVFYPENFDE